MATVPLLGDHSAGPWFRVLSLTGAWCSASAEQDFQAILPAAASAARRGRPLAAVWLCRGAGAPLELITNAVVAGPAGRDALLSTPPSAGALAAGALLFPAAARGVPASDGWLTALEGLVWAPCPGRQAPPLALGNQPLADREYAQPSRFESALTALMGRRFGWLVVAEPTNLLGVEIAELRTQVNVLRRHDEERSRFGTERAERRLAELDSFREAGLWRVRVLAGAATPDELALLAPVLTGSADLSHHSYRLGSGRSAMPLADALLAKTADPDSGAEVPFPATAGLLAALAGLPRREVPGLRVLDAGYFDVTSDAEEREAGNGDAEEREAGNGGAGEGGAGERGEWRRRAGTRDGEGQDGSEHGPRTAPARDRGQSWAGRDPVSLGAILDSQDRPVGEFLVPLPTLNRHAFITGATGAGKSQTVRHLLEQLTRAGLPWLAIEPVKSEYARMAGRLDGAGRDGLVTVVNPADPAAIPLSVNPLAPEPGYPVQPHIDMVRALFLAAFDADEPFPQIIAQALQRVYEASGWDVVTGGRAPGAAAEPAIPTLAQLQRAAIAVIADVGYGRELQADVRGFVDVRLRSLRAGSAGRFFEGGHPADIAGLLRRNVVLAIEDIANDEDKAFLMGTLIIRITEHLRLRARAARNGGLRHVIVIEEAHRLLRARREGRASAHAVELFASMLAEIRAYGEGLVIADQIPAKLIPDVVKNTALKVVHRLPAGDDRELVGATMNLGEAQSRQVVSLPPGVAAVFADGMDRPVRVRVPFGGARERVVAGPAPPALRRRSPACGPTCARGRACTLAELRHADLLAAPRSAEGAWLRVWAETLVLAFLTNRALPVVPGRLRDRWDGLDVRLRECLLATVTDRAVAAREWAVRPSYDPRKLSATVARVALRMLDQGAGGGARPGPSWVIPQVRWLHELERVCPLAGGQPDPAQCAPPLDFDLPGLADWPGMRVGHRLRALRRHWLSTELPHNRQSCLAALLGDDDQRAFAGDLATVTVGFPPGARLRQAATLMDVTAWLEVILSWPRRFVARWDQRGAGLFGFEAG